MTDPRRRADLDILGEESIYPGHPVVMAYMILRVYHGRLDDAFGRGRHYGKVEEEGSIPGAGGHASMGVNLIQRVRRGVPIDDAINIADASWAACDNQKNGYHGRREKDAKRYRARWRKGQDQADRFRERLVEELRKMQTSEATG